jgi:hypothetical protein
MSNNKLETVIFVVKKAKSYFSYAVSGPCLFWEKKDSERGKEDAVLAKGVNQIRRQPKKGWGLFNRCCCIMLDSAMAASQNIFCSYKLSIRKKTNIMQSMTKNITIFIYLIFYHREIVKLDHFMTLSVSFANTVLWCSHFRFVAAPFNLLPSTV